MLGGGVIARVLDDAFAHVEGQVEAAKARRSAARTMLHDAQGVQVVVEAQADAAHALVERLFAGVAERRMADVVGQGQRLGQVFVQPQRRATVRAICATSMVWVRRLRKWSEARLVKTWVLSSRRRKARACTMRSRSR